MKQKMHLDLGTAGLRLTAEQSFRALDREEVLELTRVPDQYLSDELTARGYLVMAGDRRRVDTGSLPASDTKDGGYKALCAEIVRAGAEGILYAGIKGLWRDVIQEAYRQAGHSYRQAGRILGLHPESVRCQVRKEVTT